MKSVSSRVISIVALGAALLGGCESDYDKLSDDLLESGWGEDAGPLLPTCVPGKPDATTPTPDASTSDAGTSDSGVSDAGSDAGNGDSGTDADASSSDASSPEAGSGDGGSSSRAF